MANFDLKTLLDSLKENVVDPYKRKLDEADLQTSMSAEEQIGAENNAEKESPSLMDKINTSVAKNSKEALKSLPDMANVGGITKFGQIKQAVSPNAAKVLQEAKAAGKNTAVMNIPEEIGGVVRQGIDEAKPLLGGVKTDLPTENLIGNTKGVTLDRIKELMEQYYGPELAQSKKFDSPAEYMAKRQNRFDLVKNMLLKK